MTGKPQRPSRPLAARLAALTLIGAGLVWAAQGGTGPEPVVAARGQAVPVPVQTTAPTGPPDDGIRNLDGLPIPEGMEGIGDRYGRVVGYVDALDVSIRGGPAPALFLAGRQTILRGNPVVDDRGEQVGWFMVGVGFHSLAETDEPAEVEAIEDHKAELDRLSVEHAGPNGENLPPPVNEDGDPIPGR